MKKLLFSLVVALTTLSARADMLVTTITAGGISNLFTAPVIVDNITILATTATNTTVKFYDAATAITNIVRSAYTSYKSYSTNYDVVHTNSSGLLVTNTFSGTYREAISNSAVTNERPRLTTIVVPASAQTSADTQIQTLRGLTALSDQACIVTVTYRPQ